MCLAQRYNTVMPVRLKPQPLCLESSTLTTEPLCSQYWLFWICAIGDECQRTHFWTIKEYKRMYFFAEINYNKTLMNKFWIIVNQRNKPIFCPLFLYQTSKQLWLKKILQTISTSKRAASYINIFPWQQKKVLWEKFGIILYLDQTVYAWMKVRNFQNPELKKFKFLNLQDANKKDWFHA